MFSCKWTKKNLHDLVDCVHALGHIMLVPAALIIQMSRKSCPNVVPIFITVVPCSLSPVVGLIWLVICSVIWIPLGLVSPTTSLVRE